MFRDGELNEEAGAVAVADGAELGAHMAGELGGNIEAEASGAGAHGDGGGLVQEAGLEAAPDGGGKSGTEIAHTDTEAAVMLAGGELAGGVGFGIVKGVDAEIVDDAIEQVAVGEGEAGFVVVGGGEGAVVTLVERSELGEDLVAETADADRLRDERPIFQAGDFGEVVDLAQGAVGDSDHLLAEIIAGGRVGLVLQGEGKLAQNRQGGFELVRCDQNTAYLHTHRYIIARRGDCGGDYSIKVTVSSNL